jgi:hypothetical protein
MTSREVLQGTQQQGVDERIAYTITTSQLGQHANQPGGACRRHHHRGSKPNGRDIDRHADEQPYGERRHYHAVVAACAHTESHVPRRSAVHGQWQRV